MESEKQPPDEQSDRAKTTSVIKRYALPLSVIASSWFCGIIACGFTCSILTSPVHVMPRDASGNLPWTFWGCWLFAIVVGVYAGLLVGKNMRSRYRKGKK